MRERLFQRYKRMGSGKRRDMGPDAHRKLHCTHRNRLDRFTMKKSVLLIFLYGAIIWLFFSASYYISYNCDVDFLSDNLEDINIIFSILCFFLIFIFVPKKKGYRVMYISLAVPIFYVSYFLSSCSLFKECL